MRFAPVRVKCYQTRESSVSISIGKAGLRLQSRPGRILGYGRMAYLGGKSEIGRVGLVSSK